MVDPSTTLPQSSKPNVDEIIQLLTREADAKIIQYQTEAKRFELEQSTADKSIEAEKAVQLDQNEKILKDRNASRLTMLAVLILVLLFIGAVLFYAPDHADKVISALLGMIGGSGLTVIYQNSRK